MNCKDCRQKLGAYLDGELGETEHREIQEHLAVCEVCARELVRLKRLSGLSKEAHPPAPDNTYFQQLPDRIVSRIQPQPAREPRWRIISSLLKRPAFYRAAGVVAAAALVVVSTIMIERAKLSTSPEMASEKYPHTLGMGADYSALKKEMKTMPRGEKVREPDKLAAESGSRLRRRRGNAVSAQSNRVLPDQATGSEEKKEVALPSNELESASPLPSPPLAGAAMPMTAAQDKAFATLTEHERQFALTDTIRALMLIEKLLKTEKDSAQISLTYRRLLTGSNKSTSSVRVTKPVSSAYGDEKMITRAAELYEQLVVRHKQDWLRSEALRFYDHYRPVLIRLLGGEEYASRVHRLRTGAIQ